MNRYKSGGPSKATANTLCQKCLRKGEIGFRTSIEHFVDDHQAISPMSVLLRSKTDLTYQDLLGHSNY